MLSALRNVSGRKHPSTVQAKQLRTCLPMLSVMLHLVTAQVIQPLDTHLATVCMNGGVRGVREMLHDGAWLVPAHVQ